MNFRAKILLAACLFSASAAASAGFSSSVSAYHCRQQGGTPVYVTEYETAEDCSFAGDFIGWCEVGSEKTTYAGCRF